MYGEVVDEVDGHLFEGELQGLKERRGARQGVGLTADDLRELIAGISRRSTSGRNWARRSPQEAPEQLRRAIRAVFDSWEAPRARVYERLRHPGRSRHRGERRQMVFGNKGDVEAGVFPARPLDQSTASASSS